jgi:hypothetical protein
MTQQAMGWVVGMKRVLVPGREVQKVEGREIHCAWDYVLPVKEQVVKQVEVQLTMVVQVTVQVVVNRWG